MGCDPKPADEIDVTHATAEDLKTLENKTLSYEDDNGKICFCKLRETIKGMVIASTVLFKGK